MSWNSTSHVTNRGTALACYLVLGGCALRSWGRIVLQKVPHKLECPSL